MARAPRLIILECRGSAGQDVIGQAGVADGSRHDDRSHHRAECQAGASAITGRVRARRQSGEQLEILLDLATVGGAGPPALATAIRMIYVILVA